MKDARLSYPFLIEETNPYLQCLYLSLDFLNIPIVRDIQFTNRIESIREISHLLSNLGQPHTLTDSSDFPLEEGGYPILALKSSNQQPVLFLPKGKRSIVYDSETQEFLPVKLVDLSQLNLETILIMPKFQQNQGLLTILRHFLVSLMPKSFLSSIFFSSLVSVFSIILPLACIYVVNQILQYKSLPPVMGAITILLTAMLGYTFSYACQRRSIFYWLHAFRRHLLTGSLVNFTDQGLSRLSEFPPSFIGQFLHELGVSSHDNDTKLPRLFQNLLNLFPLHLIVIMLISPALAKILAIAIFIYLVAYALLFRSFLCKRDQVVNEKMRLNSQLHHIVDHIANIRLSGRLTEMMNKLLPNLLAYKHGEETLKRVSTIYVPSVLYFLAVGVGINYMYFTIIGTPLQIHLLVGAYVSYFFFVTGLIGLADSLFAWASLDGLFSQLPRNYPSGGKHIKVNGLISFSHVSFHYEDAERLILDTCDQPFFPGEKISIYGQTGSGKTTLLKLFLGIEDPTSGKIFCDDYPIRTLDPNDFHSQIGHNLNLDRRLVAGNIYSALIGPRDIEINAVWEMLDNIGLFDDIHDLPMKLATLISDIGESFSDTQMQLLDLCRILLAAPPVIILDDPLKGLSVDHQRQIFGYLQTLPALVIILSSDEVVDEFGSRHFRLTEGQLQSI